MVRKKERNKSYKSDNETKFTDEFLNAIDKDKILSNAQEIINSAVNVLEEEIAAGILAAKKIEKEVIDVDDIRHNPDDLMNRIRRDTHEAVDLFIDALTAITKHVSELSTTLDNKNGASNHSESVNGQGKENAISFIEAEEPLQPGKSTSIILSVFDDHSEAPVNIKIQKTDLTGPQKQIIHSRAIKIVPSTVTLKPGEEKEISVQINVPKYASSGKYHAMLTDENNHDFRVVIGIEVKE